MSNMGYCRFQNTLSDLRDCVEALEDGKKLSDEERAAADRMVEVAETFIELMNDAEWDKHWAEQDDDTEDLSTTEREEP